MGEPGAGGTQDWAAKAQSQVSYNISEKALEEKERRLRESISQNYGRIKDVERELSELQLQLRMNVGPKKAGLEMLRRKIEAQNERLALARAADAAAAAAAKHAAEALAQEERVKEQLCQELNLLVQQSARSQLDKLEQLTERLTALNAGFGTPGQGAAGPAAPPAAAANAAAAAALQQDAEALRGAILATTGANGEGPQSAAPAAAPAQNQPAEAQAEQPQQQQQQRSSPGTHGTAAVSGLRQPGQQQRQQQQQQQSEADAAAARSRHVSLNSKLPQARGPRPQPPPAQQEQPPVQKGPFQGFD